MSDELVEKVAFLLDRLDDFENSISDEGDAREYHGHVRPAAARLRAAIAALAETQNSEREAVVKWLKSQVAKWRARGDPPSIQNAFILSVAINSIRDGEHRTNGG